MLDSLQTRLTLLYAAILAAAIGVIAFSSYVLILREHDEDLNNRMGEMSQSFIAAIRAESDEMAAEGDEGPEHIVLDTAAEFRFRDYQFVVRDSSGRVIASTAEYPVTTLARGPGPFHNVEIEGRKYLSLVSDLKVLNSSYELVVLHSLDDRSILSDQLLRIFLITGSVCLVLASLAGYWVTRARLRPLLGMTRHAETLSEKNLSERLLVENPRDEVGKLAQVFNALLGRLDAAFDQQRRFMADASHELRTPLAIVRGESEVALTNRNRQAAEYHESLAIVHEESERLTKIVDDLFILARGDAGQVRIQSNDLYLDDIVSDTAGAVRVLADQKNIAVKVSCEMELPIKGDEQLLRRLVLNLMDNAIKYTPAGGAVDIKGKVEDAHVHVDFVNTGPSIPPDEHDRIFDRFYRIDKVRSRDNQTETGGAGLGLPISRWIAEIHGGTVKLVESTMASTTFAIILPLNDR